ncbi:RNA-directed DNA polymerase, eukaryota, reverse transcriptase zinc-binding domain protein [Tanacetum coccineum]
MENTNGKQNVSWRQLNGKFNGKITIVILVRDRSPVEKVNGTLVTKGVLKYDLGHLDMLEHEVEKLDRMKDKMAIDHIGRVIYLVILNEVRIELERFDSTFSYGDATIFNSFTHDTGLIDLPMGGRHFTWVNKVGSKMSKLDRFLNSDDDARARIPREARIDGHEGNLKWSKESCLMVFGIQNLRTSNHLSLTSTRISLVITTPRFPSLQCYLVIVIVDRDFLESMVSMDEIKAAVWDCGSQKSPGPDGRQILDGPFILSETIDWYKKRKKKMTLFKVDFEKAFNSASWMYIDYVLDKLGFGLRQGDPLSPFLFIIVMEGLHMALNDGLAANMFHGVKVISPGMHLSHLFYADDVIILSK